MTKFAIIEKTTQAINLLPPEKAEEISDFADFVLKRYEENTLTDGIKAIVAGSGAFDFLIEETDLYSLADLKERF